MSYRNYGYKGGKGKGGKGPGGFQQQMDMRDENPQSQNAVSYCKYVDQLI